MALRELDLRLTAARQRLVKVPVCLPAKATLIRQVLHPIQLLRLRIRSQPRKTWHQNRRAGRHSVAQIVLILLRLRLRHDRNASQVYLANTSSARNLLSSLGGSKRG